MSDTHCPTCGQLARPNGTELPDPRDTKILALELLITRLVKAIPHSLCFDAMAYAEAEKIAVLHTAEG